MIQTRLSPIIPFLDKESVTIEGIHLKHVQKKQNYAQTT